MKTPERFERAVTKLYEAFHSGELQAGNCTKCAIGNMCGNNGMWAFKFFTGALSYGLCDLVEKTQYSAEENQIILKSGYGGPTIYRIDELPMHMQTEAYEVMELAEKAIASTGYNQEQLELIEFVFEGTVGGDNSKEAQFQGLCAVIEVLCDIEGVDNVMDYKNLFQYENERVQLSEVF